MKLSIIIVNYKVKDLLINCIQSIYRNPPSCAYEILVADNCSQDGSECVADLPQVTYMSLPKNGGFAYANNRALEQASGDYVLFLNPDTLMCPDTLNICLEKFKDEHIGCVGCRVLLENGSLDLACRRGFPTIKNAFFKFTGLDKCLKTPFFSGYNLLHLPENGEYFVDCVVGAFMMVSRKALQVCGSFDERFFMYGEDIDLCYRFRQHGFLTFYAGSCSIIHKKGASSKKSKDARQAFYDSMDIYYDLHYASKHNPFINHLVHSGVRLLKWIKG